IDAAKKESYAALEPVEKKEYYALSPAQKRLYVLYRLESENINYNMPQVIPFPGEIDIERMQAVFKELIGRHESLRTSFAAVDEEPIQEINAEVPFEIEVFSGVQGAIVKSFIRPFDLGKAPLLRVGIIKEGNGKDTLLVDMHHIITDGTSNRILNDEFNLIYSGRGVVLPRLRLQYKDYASWQNSGAQRALIKEQESYWLDMYAEEVPVLHLPTDYPRPGIQSFEGSKVEFILSETESGTLKGLTKETGLTLYMSILSVFTILLSRLSGQEDIVVGTPVAARRHTDLEKIIGMFVNMLALRNHVPVEASYREFVKELRDRTLKAYENQEYQFEILVEKINVVRDIARNPVFDVVFNLLNMEEAAFNSLFMEPGSSEHYTHREGTAKFDLILMAVERGERIHLSFEYCTRLFKPGTIERYISYLKNIIEKLRGNIDQNLAEIDILSPDEREQILREFNNTAVEYPEDKTIDRIFTEQAERSPDRIALIGPVQPVQPVQHVQPFNLTYRRLNEQSDRLASVLIQKGVLPDDITGMKMERSVEMIIAIMGILKSGGAYLPIDPEYPQERIDYMLKDSGAKILLTENDIIFNFHHSSFIIHHSNHSSQLAYIIYTSGTTGKPKGVLIEHKNVVRLLFNERFQFDFNDQDVWSLFHSYNF
ncbi:MAG TPA: condensation domain-containing protein, partial [Candidatus Deferrimicrobium sp.]|nr:condensation domain-containing protein [Candidatus Deferrimicrobium sp.]